MAFPLLALGGLALSRISQFIKDRRTTARGVGTGDPTPNSLAAAAAPGGGFQPGDIRPGSRTTQTVSEGGKTAVPGTRTTRALENDGSRAGEVRPGSTTIRFNLGATGPPGTGAAGSGAQTPATNTTQPTTPQPDNSNLAAELGAASIARSRKRNKEQQATLSGQALS